jgi:hypothetical protein
VCRQKTGFVGMSKRRVCVEPTGYVLLSCGPRIINNVVGLKHFVKTSVMHRQETEQVIPNAAARGLRIRVRSWDELLRRGMCSGLHRYGEEPTRSLAILNAP